MFVNYDDLPRVLEVKDLKQFLNIGMRQTYELVHSGAFPVVIINRRIKIPKSTFLLWFEGGHEKKQ